MKIRFKGEGGETKVVTLSTDCAFAMPGELTGRGIAVCGIVWDVCNGLGKRCIAYKKHTSETLKDLAQAMETMGGGAERSGNERVN